MSRDPYPMNRDEAAHRIAVAAESIADSLERLVALAETADDLQRIPDDEGAPPASSAAAPGTGG